jgi:hypothetical protein
MRENPGWFSLIGRGGWAGGDGYERGGALFTQTDMIFDCCVYLFQRVPFIPPDF